MTLADRATIKSGFQYLGGHYELIESSVDGTLGITC